MIQSILANRWPISAVLSDESVTRRQDRNLDLKSEQWKLLEELVKPLEFLEVATVFLSKEYNVSCSCVYPIMDGLITNISPCEDDLPIIRQFKTVVCAALYAREEFQHHSYIRL